MTQTTTSVNACDAAIKLDDESGIPIDISGSSNVVNLEFAQDVQEYYTMYTGRFPLRVSIRNDAAIGIEAVYSTANNEAIDMLSDWYFNYPNTTRTLSVYIPDYTIGSDMYSGEVILDRLIIPAEAEESAPIPIEAILLPSGTWTKATKAT